MDSSPTGLAAGDEVAIEIDPEWLPLDALPAERSVGELLQGLGRPRRLILRDGGGREVLLAADQEPDLVIGAGLSGMIGPQGREARLRIISTGDTPVLELATSSRPVPEVPQTAGRIVIERTGLELLFEALRGVHRDDPLSDLHGRAMELSLAQALDVLMCENQLRELTPFDYQRRVVRRVMGRMRGHVILADEVGLGKTIEAAMTLLEYQARGLVKKTLILTPPTLVGQWGEELRRHFGVSLVMQDEPPFRDALPDPWYRFPTLIASLATAKREPHRSLVLAREYDLVIIDEAHHLRNATTQAWKFVNQLRKRFMLLLTATPIQNDLKELFNLVTLLRPGQLGTFKSFKGRFVAADGAKNVGELRQLLEGVMIRNRRSDTGLALPPRTAHTVSVQPSTTEAEVYGRLGALVRRRHRGQPGAHETMRLRMLQLAGGSSPAALAATLAASTDPELESLRTLLATVDVPAKTLRFLQVLQELDGEKAVIFTQFRATLDHLAAFVERTGFGACLFHGGLSRLEKDRSVARFEQEVQLLICTESGSEGRNLQFCRNLVNFDLPWNPMRIEQRLGRLHRIGQTREVRVTNLVTAGTLEHDLIDVLERKLDLFALVVGEMDMILGDLEEETGFEEVVFDAWAGAADEVAARASMEALGDRLHEAKKAFRFQQELNESILGDRLGVEGQGDAPEDGAQPQEGG
ncbi:MAG: DEAD/DEAH box helicase [Candidatus Riflebacteria bacterium]|nr:DEAD/DEAH box helicase [Candidatus Riflebacteria bacterium]